MSDTSCVYDRGAFRYDGVGVSVPVTLVNAFPYIDADLKLADGETVRGRMVIDVGSNWSVSLTKAFVDEHRLRQRVGPTIRRTGGGGVGGATTRTSAVWPRYDRRRRAVAPDREPLRRLRRRDVAIEFREGNIGGAILRRFTVYLDYHAKRMIFEPNATTHDPFESDMSGVTFRMDDSDDARRRCRGARHTGVGGGA